MNKYKLVERYSCLDLEERINELIKEGWKPIGGICFGGYVSEKRGYYRGQAMIKELRENE